MVPDTPHMQPNVGRLESSPILRHEQEAAPTRLGIGAPATHLPIGGMIVQASMRMRRKGWSTEAVRTSCLVGTLATMILLWTVARRLVRNPCMTC